jgi:hypothetical protein
VDYNVSRVQEILAAHPHFPISLYRTSAVSADPTEAHIKKLVDKVAFLRLYPKFLFPYDLFHVAGLHVSAVYIYFISMQAEPNFMMAGVGRKVPFASNYINAASDDEQVSMLMRQKRYQQPSWGEHYFMGTDHYKFSDKKPR